MTTSGKRMVAGLVGAVRTKGTEMIKRSLDWLVPGNVNSATEDELQRQLDGARDLHSAALAHVESAVADLDSAADAATVEAAAGALARAHADVERAAAYVGRAARAIARHEAAQAAAKRAKLEQRMTELEASLERAVLETATRPLDEAEADLLTQVVQVRARRHALASEAGARMGELIRVRNALGLDADAVARSLETWLNLPNHSHVVTEFLDRLAMTYAVNDPRRKIAADIAASIVPRHYQVAAE